MWTSGSFASEAVLTPARQKAMVLTLWVLPEKSLEEEIGFSHWVLFHGIVKTRKDILFSEL
jgi:hypothetical protein